MLAPHNFFMSLQLSRYALKTSYPSIPSSLAVKIFLLAHLVVF